MKKSIIVLALTLISVQYLIAQSFGVGINTPNASAIMDLTSTDKGVLIPRLTTAQRGTITPLGVAQDGLLIYNTTTNQFNYWDGAAWQVFGGSGSEWYEESSVNLAASPIGDIYRPDKVGIGLTSALTVASALHARSIGTETFAATVDNTTGRSGMDINITGTGSLSQSTAININHQADGNIDKVGIYNTMQGGGSGTAIGVQNLFASFSTYTGGSIIGVYNFLNSTSGSASQTGIANYIDNAGTGIKYGSYNFITNTSGGVHYGVYSNVLKSGSFAGYFLGRVSIGTTTGNNYLLPPSRGTNGQVMQTDGTGNVTWVTPSIGTDDQNLLTPTLVGTTLNLNIESGTGTSIDLAPIRTSEWYNEMTTTPTTNTTVDMYRSGNVGIGLTSSDFIISPLQVVNSLAAIPYSATFQNNNGNSGIDVSTIGVGTSGVSTGINVDNSTTGTINKFGIYNAMRGGGSGDAMAIRNWFLSTSTYTGGVITGVYNYLNSASGTAIQRGVYNYIDNAGTGNKYGSFNEITSTSGGTHYGVYSNVLKSGSWAGYFLGRVYVGTTTGNGYNLPGIDGTASYVMQTNGAGQASWVNPSTLVTLRGADNGLGLSGNNIGLGGTLGRATTINLSTFGVNFNMNSTGDFNVQDAVTTVFSVQDNGNAFFTNKTSFGKNTDPNFLIDAEQTINTETTGINLVKTDNTTAFTYGHYILKTGNGTGRSHAIYTEVLGAGAGQKYGIFNELNSAAAGSQYAVRNWIRSATADNIFGVYNNIENAGTGAQYAVYNAMRNSGSNQVRGVHNEFDTPLSANEFTGVRNQIGNGTPGSGGFNGVYNDISNANNGTYYGTRTEYTGAATGSGVKYGTYNLITSTAGGTHFGTFNNVAVANGWAGYFLGKNYISDRLSIGITDNPNAGINVNKNSSGTYSHIEVTETQTGDGARIRFNNSIQTDNNWTLYGATSNTVANNDLNVFNIFHNSSGNIVRIESDGADGLVGIAGRNPTTNALEVNGTASKNVAGSWLANSDERLKKNIQNMDSETILQKILAMRGVTYEWNDDKTGYNRPEGIQYGFIAQDLQKIWPTKVTEDNDGFLQTAYSDYDAMFVEAFKAQQKQIEALQKENDAYLEQLTQQKETIEALSVSVEKLLKTIVTVNE
jgi:hypothetical protein